MANAVRTQNIEAALGQVGQAPMHRTQAFQLPLDTLGRLSDPAQFADIVVKTRGSQPISTAGGTGPSQGGGMPGSGTPAELMDAAGISAGHIAQAARDLLGA